VCLSSVDFIGAEILKLLSARTGDRRALTVVINLSQQQQQPQHPGGAGIFVATLPASLFNRRAPVSD